jgi:hypothetical protein
MASNEREVARKADTIIAQADKDGDGVINYDEFVLVSKRFPNILYPSVSGVKRASRTQRDRHRRCWWPARPTD